MPQLQWQARAFHSSLPCPFRYPVSQTPKQYSQAHLMPSIYKTIRDAADACQSALRKKKAVL